MGWGAMMGLGQSLQQVGGMLMDNHKSKMKEKLELEREERADARTIASENRAQTRLETTPDPSATRYVKNTQGVLMEQVRSRTGAVLEEKLAPPDVVAERKREEKKAELDETSKMLDIGIKSNTLKYAPKLSEASLEQSAASAWRSRNPSTGGGGAPPKPSALSTPALDAYFRTTGKDGKMVVDREGLASFMQSEDYRTSTDRDAAAAEWVRKREEGKVSGLRAGGTPEFAIDKILAGEDVKVPTREALKPAAQKIYDDLAKKLERAESLIENKTLTPVQAAARFESEGFPEVARQLRVRYGIN